MKRYRQMNGLKVHCTSLNLLQSLIWGSTTISTLENTGNTVSGCYKTAPTHNR
jgi:hypothetical protein